MDIVAVPEAPARKPTRRPRVTLWVLRLSVTVHLLLVLAQPVLAGRFLTGDVDAIAVHGTIGSLMVLPVMVLIAVSLLYVLVGRGRILVLPVSVLLFFADSFQVALGYSQELHLHVPLGVAIVVTSVLLAGWAWTPSAARPRRAR